MTGTEKQIRYATDIINKTVAKMEDTIAKGTARIEAREAQMQRSIPGYRDHNNRKTLDAWIEVLNQFRSAKFADAAEVINIEKSFGWYRYCDNLVSEITGNGSQI